LRIDRIALTVNPCYRAIQLLSRVGPKINVAVRSHVSLISRVESSEAFLANANIIDFGPGIEQLNSLAHCGRDGSNIRPHRRTCDRNDFQRFFC
jgi:hypothetical protein